MEAALYDEEVVPISSDERVEAVRAARKHDLHTYDTGAMVDNLAFQVAKREDKGWEWRVRNEVSNRGMMSESGSRAAIG